MKLLIVTQAVDTEDPILGFFVRWVEEFAKHCEKVTVICLREGKYTLPVNVSVYSLGKEKGVSRIKYIFNFYRYIWQFRHDYDVAFVHMNQEYVLLGGLFWHLWGKKVMLWRNHAKGDLFTQIAVLLSNKIFYTSSQSFTARFKKALHMPVGIDTDFFTPGPLVPKKPNSILFLGRIAPVKNIDTFIEALCELKKLGVEFSVTIAGVALPKDAEYEKTIRNNVSAHGLDKNVRFMGPVTQEQARALYQEHALYVNLTPSGSMDKTIFEAMACGTTPLVFNHDFIPILGEDLTILKLDVSEIVKKIQCILIHKNNRNFRNFVTENHSIKMLAEKIVAVCQ